MGQILDLSIGFIAFVLSILCVAVLLDILLGILRCVSEKQWLLAFRLVVASMFFLIVLGLGILTTIGAWSNV